MMARLSICAALTCALGLSPALGAEIASGWTADKPETKSRLIAGLIAGQAGQTMAAVEITLADGWKTYWRFPGDAGGVPPSFDWSKSDNVASVKVLYPAPKRLTDKSGDTLGYKGAVVFPVAFEAKDKAKPVALKLQLDYGICKDVCIPVGAEFSVDIPAGSTAALPASVTSALDHIPRPADARKPADPKLLKTEVKLDGAMPTIALEAEFPGGAAKADAFVESQNGYYIPLPKAGSAKDIGQNRLRFEIDLTGAVDPADIKGKLATVTLISEQGLSEATFKLE